MKFFNSNPAFLCLDRLHMWEKVKPGKRGGELGLRDGPCNSKRALQYGKHVHIYICLYMCVYLHAYIYICVYIHMYIHVS